MEENKNTTTDQNQKDKASLATEQVNESSNAPNDSSSQSYTVHKKVKTRQGSGYLRQLYSTARSTATTTHSNLSNRTTFMVNFVPVDKVDPSELQVRSHFDDEEIEALAHSIKEHGVLQPILVVQNGDRYKVIAGERRLRASKRAGVDRIPARVMTSDDKGIHEVALRENLDRVDLHPIEEGEGYVDLLEAKLYESHDAIAEAFKKPKSRITECVGFTRLPSETKGALIEKGFKQRSLLRKLMNTPPEQHLEVIALYSKTEESGELILSGQSIGVPATSAAVSTSKAARPNREEKAFEYKCDAKGLKVPGFKWKVGEGADRAKKYVRAMQRLLEEMKDKHPDVFSS